jgi:pimeloyl-ACP methyl ester carboxylesterase
MSQTLDVHSSPVEIAPYGLPGDLRLPEGPRGLVVFAHGSGSSRHSPRNNAVARALNAHGFATLLFDLLTEDEEADRNNVFDIPLLSQRLIAAIDWAREQAALKSLPLGLFGASTGAGAALVAASERPGAVSAVVSRGGRPDLADGVLPSVQAPTLLIVGGNDVGVIELNERALKSMLGDHRIEIVPGATHLFPEEGALEAVMDLAARWFEAHLTGKDNGLR